MAGINITTFEYEILGGAQPRLRLKYGTTVVTDFPLTDGQWRDLEDWDQDTREARREAFVAVKFGKLFEMLAEREAGADARSLEERGV